MLKATEQEGVSKAVTDYARKVRRVAALERQEARLQKQDKEPSQVRSRVQYKGAVNESSLSDDSIHDSSEKSNTEFQERDYMPTDRELLMEAATDARASDELRAYARKQKTLEALERKLRRQQEALEAAESGPEVEEDPPSSVGSADSFSPEGGEAKGKNGGGYQVAGKMPPTRFRTQFPPDAL